MGYMGAAWATLICYASMMLISYFTGQNVYPIPYQVPKLLLYFGIALAIYFFSESLNHFFHLSSFVRFSINTVLLLSYTGWVYKKEKLKSVVTKSSGNGKST